MPFEDLTLSNIDHVWIEYIDIWQYRLLLGVFLLYTDRVPFKLLDSAALVWRESSGGGGQIF
jgi:hypothetical protein